MTSLINTFRTTGRAAAIALVLGASAITAAPAMAQSGQPQFNFQLDLGSGGGASMSMQAPKGRVAVPDHNRYRYCLTDREIRRGLAQYGFRDARITREFGRNRVEVVARYGRDFYSMRVDRCTGEVNRVERMRRPGGGFGLQFNFGN